MDLKNEVFCVVGLGRSGCAAVRLLRRKGAQVRAYDARSREELSQVWSELEALGAEMHSGQLSAELFAGVSRVVLSPGVPPAEARRFATAVRAEVLGEVELASRFIQGQLVAITGTNGKSTVTRMLGDILERGAGPVFVGGNLGTPLSEAVDTDAAGPEGVLVVEVSSFQLEAVKEFHAHVAVLLNVTDDHLDRYQDFAAYAAAKGRVFAAQTAEDFALVPDGDAFVTSLAKTGDAEVLHFAGERSVVRMEGDALLSRDGALRLPLAELGVSGQHNAIDACAAASAALLLGAPVENIDAALRDFRGLPHRMQLICERAGVRFVDDSKATNVGAAAAALRGFGSGDARVVLIAGGRDKGGTYAPLVEPLMRVGRAIVCIGEAAPKLERDLAQTSLPIRRAATMAEAVRLGFRLADAGDTVLLSPACSSYDMFATYAHRGDAFAGAARGLRDAPRGTC
ncbi:MAG: UDP-N-acetylmuramoyl-L-alanine--D-glutamate ligase [Deltaproteobacteria bacterium]|nr:UDP-N-acetylmuramoyl-L-alanine--D-glutamate ligase [Deltaproteobacteria bacterium]